MKVTDFNKTLTSLFLLENLQRKYGVSVDLNKYDREQLEDIRNKLRTKIFQQESGSGINDLLTNETYQKDKAMLELLNTRIKEMLGEDIKKLKDKLDQLNEAKKGVRAPKYTKKAKGATAAKDYDGDGKVEPAKDEVWGSRAKAAAKAGKPFGKKDKAVDEDRVVKGRAYGGSAQKDDDDDEKPTKATKKSSAPAKGSSEKSAADRAKDAKMDRDQEKAGKDWEKRGYKRTVVKGKSQSGSPKDDDKDLDEATTKKPSKKDAKKQQAKENFRRNVKMVNEGLHRFILEDEEEKAKVITAASDIANDFTSWMQRVGQFQTKVMIELSDEIRHEFGAEQSAAFKQMVGPALSATLETLTTQREAISNAIATLAGEGVPQEPMGTEPMTEPEVGPTSPDMMNEPAAGDEFAAADAAAGEGSPGREVRESKEDKKLRKLAEQHSIIFKLAK